MNQKFRNAVLTLGLLAAAATPAFARFEPVTCGNNPFTPEQEIAEGNKVALEVYKQMPVLPDNDPVSRYIQQLGARLVQQAPLVPGVNQQWPFNFHVVASQDINAFALPGGSIFVNLGTIQAAETEAQLAGVMAHEISHDVMRHSTCNLVHQRNKSILYGLGQIGSSILLGNGTVGQLAQTGLGIGQSLDFLRMSRTDEQQADLLGVNILDRSNFDPRGLPQFFEVIQAKYGAGGAQFLSDHPNPGNRMQYVNAEIATLPQLDRPIVSEASYNQIHSLAMQHRALSGEDIKTGGWKGSGQYASQPGGSARVQQSGAGYPQQGNQQNGNQQQGNYPQRGNTDPQNGNQGQQGQNAGGIAPLSRTRLGLRDRLNTFQGPGWSIRYPSTWRQTADGNASGGNNQVNQQGQRAQTPATTLAPPGGAGSFGLAYGVVIGVERFGDNNGVYDVEDLGRATDAITQRFLAADPNMSQTGSTNQVTVNGQPAMAVELRGTSPVINGNQRQTERDLLVVVVRPDGDVNYLVFVAPQQDFPTLKSTFDSMLRTFSSQ